MAVPDLRLSRLPQQGNPTITRVHHHLPAKPEGGEAMVRPRDALGLAGRAVAAGERVPGFFH